MRRKKTDQIIGREILAKDVHSSGGVVLISAGTILKKEYVDKLLELKITDVFVEDEISREIQIKDITEEKISEQCTEKLKIHWRDFLMLQERNFRSCQRWRWKLWREYFFRRR